MKYVFLSLLFLQIGCSPKAAWQPLFNGEDLSDFEILNGSAKYEIEDDCIVGISKMDEQNTFLATKKKYRDFILEFEVLVDTSLNSGVQFRSIADPGIKGGAVHGYQCEIESSDRRWAGGVYDESRRGWLYPLTTNPTGQAAFKVNQWNKYRVEAIGSDIRTWINGVQCANLVDDVTDEGLIGLQVHGIGSPHQVGKKVKWRKLNILTENLEKYRWKVENYAPVIDLTLKVSE